jgi:hypothetical protein
MVAEPPFSQVAVQMPLMGVALVHEVGQAPSVRRLAGGAPGHIAAQVHKTAQQTVGDKAMLNLGSHDFFVSDAVEHACWQGYRYPSTSQAGAAVTVLSSSAALGLPLLLAPGQKALPGPIDCTAVAVAAAY